MSRVEVSGSAPAAQNTNFTSRRGIFLSECAAFRTCLVMKTVMPSARGPSPFTERTGPSGPPLHPHVRQRA
jgi:hypothetical protein